MKAFATNNHSRTIYSSLKVSERQRDKTNLVRPLPRQYANVDDERVHPEPTRRGVTPAWAVTPASPWVEARTPKSRCPRGQGL